MCLPMGSCFGPPRTDDDLGPPTKHGVPASSRGQPAQRNYNGGNYHGGNYNGNAGHYYNGNTYPAHGAAAGTEADRKASNDVRRGTAHAVPAAATRGWHGHGQAAAGAQEKADGTLKQQQPVVRNDKVAGADGARGVAHNYYHHHEREQQPAHREDTAVDFYHHPAVTATADHESPSEALGGE